jgi:serine/threonine protein kinase
MVLKKTRKYKLKKLKNKKTRRKNKMGGEAIAAGGYGCVFKPVLRCETRQISSKQSSSKQSSSKQSSSKQRNKNLVSKLLMKEDAFDEMEEIEGILKFIKKNPNNSKYFIINDQVSICKPAPLSKEDLHNYDKVCLNTKVGQSGINSTNINENLDKLNIINQIDGGKDLDVYIQTHYFKKLNNKERVVEFRKLNTSLINLLINAIVKINKDGLYHLDIKGSNILLGKDGNTRLIDWGASFVYHPLQNTKIQDIYSSKSITNSKYNIPQRIFNKAIFQFNLPFSIILFFENFDDILMDKMDKIKETKLAEKNEIVNYLAEEIILISLKESGEGHFQLILEYMINTYNYGNNNNNNNSIFTQKDAYNVIIQYISNVLLNFLDFSTFKFNLEKFFNNVFRHNIDVYGFLMSYNDFILQDDKKEENIYKELAEIIIEFCYSTKYASKPIPIKTLITRLKMLNKIST